MKHQITDRASSALASKRAEILIEALPWIKEASGKTVVIKYGGAAMVDESIRASVVSDIVLMKLVGLNPIVVHGGGNDISDTCRQFGLPVDFKNGMRVTDDATMDVVKMVLVGKVNQELVRAMNEHGHIAVGVSGSDAGVFSATQLDPQLGRVGVLGAIDTSLVADLVETGYIPVIATVAAADDGGFYNVNADLAAGKLAAALAAEKIIFLTDVDGLYEDFSDKESLISSMSLDEARGLVEMNKLSKGMIPKITACVEALDGGVAGAYILNGTFPHAMLLEVFTDSGIGTMITHED